MPSCVVRWCKNNTTNHKKGQGITFHRFPKNDLVWKEDWCEIIRNCRSQHDWIPSVASVVCSIHFDPNDLYITKNGIRRVVTYAVPKLLLFKLPKMQEQPVVLNSSIALRELRCHQSFEPSVLPNPTSSTRQTLPTIEGDWVTDSEPTSSFQLSDSLDTSLTVPQTTLIIKDEGTTESEPSSFEPLDPLSTSITFEQSPEKLGGETTTFESFDIARKCRLKEQIKKKNIIIKNQRNKIKTLNQKIRRLLDRNKSFKTILKHLKKQNYEDP